MKKKSTFFVLLLFCFVVACPGLNAAGKDKRESKTPDIDINAGITLAYNSAKIKFDEEAGMGPNTLIYPYLALQLEIDAFDFITLGALVGFNSNHFKDPINVTSLPLSLGFDQDKYRSIMFGVNAYSGFYEIGDFTVIGKGEYLYFKMHRNTFDLSLPIASGSATGANSFSQLNVQLLVQYDGFSNISIFFGPQLNLIDGEFKVEETIADLNAESTLKYHQQKTFGLVGGVNFEVGDNLTVELEAALLAKTGFTARILYIF